MKWSTTLWLLVLALLLGGLIWLGERERGGRPAAGPDPQQVLPFSPAQVDDLEIEQPTLTVRLVRKDAAWFLVKPVQGRADAGEVERILGVFETLHRREVVSEEDRHQRDLDLGDYGLAPPRARVTLGGGAGRHELLVGGDAPLGGMVYVKASAGSDVFAVPHDVLTALPQDLERLRDRIVLPGDAARTVRLEIQRPGGGLVQLAPTRNGWMIQQPVSLRADAARVQRMLDGLYTLRAERFVWDPPPAGTTTQAVEQSATGVAVATGDARLETYGLATDTAQLRIQVWAPGDQTGKELRIGKPLDETATLLYANQRDQAAIYAVSSAITNLFAVTVNDLRDRALFALDAAKIRSIGFQAGDQRLNVARDEKTGWNIIEPVQWKADDEVIDDLALRISRLRIEAVIESAATNLAAYRLAEPEFVLTVAEAASPDTNAVPAPETATAQDDARLLVGRAAPGDENSYVMFRNSPTVLAVAEASLQPLRLRLADPLLYRNRTMLALRAADVWRIVLSKGGKDQAVTRAEKGDWTAVGPAGFTVATESLADILKLVARLRAERIEIHNPRHLASYGLDRTGVTLSFNLSGGEGIQRTLILGYRARTDGIYAMIQGQDVVFVLANAAAERLTRDLLRPVPREVEVEPASNGPSR